MVLKVFCHSVVWEINVTCNSYRKGKLVIKYNKILVKQTYFYKFYKSQVYCFIVWRPLLIHINMVSTVTIFPDFVPGYCIVQFSLYQLSSFSRSYVIHQEKKRLNVSLFVVIHYYVILYFIVPIPHSCLSLEKTA